MTDGRQIRNIKNLMKRKRRKLKWFKKDTRQIDTAEMQFKEKLEQMVKVLKWDQNPKVGGREPVPKETKYWSMGSQEALSECQNRKTIGVSILKWNWLLTRSLQRLNSTKKITEGNAKRKWKIKDCRVTIKELTRTKLMSKNNSLLIN